MHLSLRILIAVALRIRPAGRPTRPQQYDGPFRNPPVPLLPLFHARRRKLKIRVFRSFRAHVQHDRGPHQLLCRDLVHRHFPRRKVCRRIHMCPVMFEHPEAPREVAVLLDGRIHLCFEEFLISGPGHQLVVNRVTEIEHSRLPWRNSFEHRILARLVWKHCHEGGNAKGEHTGTAHGRHRISPVQFYGSGIPGVATIPAMRRISWYSVSLIIETISRTFFRSFIFFSAGLARSSASVTCRGSFSKARKSATKFFSLRSCGSGYGSRVTSAIE